MNGKMRAMAAAALLMVTVAGAQPADSLFLMGGMHSAVWNDASSYVSYLPDMKTMGGNWA